MKPGANAAAPVLLLARGPAGAEIQRALEQSVALTIIADPARANALAATGGFLAILSVEPEQLRAAHLVDPAQPHAIAGVVATAIARSHAIEDEDPVAALPYEEYIELARYATTRRYLIALLHRHDGSVTEAARGAHVKRESLHRLLRRHHLIADDFREP